MPPRHILFISVQGHGHVYPSLGVVSELVRRGHRITYVTTKLFSDVVEAAGATVAPYTSEFDTFHVPDVIGRDDAEAQIHLVYLRENIAILRAAEAALDGDVPDLIAYDVFPFIAGRLLAARWGRPAVRLSPIFASNENYSVFEALWRSSGFGHPADVPEFHWQMTDLLAGYGFHTPLKEFWDEPEGLNIVFIPKSFQVAGETFDDRFVFVGPSLGKARLEATWPAPGPDVPVLLVSLGNQFNEHPEFFKACAEAFAGTPWHVVMAVGEFLDVATLGPLPSNVEVHPFVPFLAVLEHAKVCLTQGTTGAVMESLYHGCPMVVVPHFAPEARPSAERVVDLGLGLHLAPDQLDAQTIGSAVLGLAEDPEVQERVGRMRRDVRSAGGAARAADEIEKYLA